jgi:hypothetical protein
MKKISRIASLCAFALTAAAVQAAESPTLLTAKELKWVDLDQPKGARQAPLWGDVKSSENAVMVRWPFNTKVADQVRNQDLHIVVFAGTFTTETVGGYREFGPGRRNRDSEGHEAHARLRSRGGVQVSGAPPGRRRGRQGKVGSHAARRRQPQEQEEICPET